MGLEIAPGAMSCSTDRPFLFYVVDAFLMQDLFEVATELGALERFGGKIVPQGLILKVLADLLKAFLSVD
jgi:hypothetical protein